MMSPFRSHARLTPAVASGTGRAGYSTVPRNALSAASDGSAAIPLTTWRSSANAGAAHAGGAPSKGRVVLAGGDAAQGKMIRRTLEGDGYTVIAQPTGRDAVISLIQDPADVLLVNAPLSDGSAAALVRWARARPVSALMTCMVICPSHDSTTVAKLYDAGADFVITRQTELDLLPRKVSAALARRPLALAS